MRAVTIQRFGDPGGLQVSELPEPLPAAGQVSLRTEAVGVAGVDAFIRRGALGSSHQTGGVLGSEAAGVVTSVGSGVDRTWIGRRVWAFTGTSGAYAEHVVARVDDLTPVPEALSSVDAVTLGSSATVAHFALAHAHLHAGDSVLVRGAGGSIGIATVQLAARSGASTIAVTTSSSDRGRRLRELGATHVLDRAGTGDPGAPEAYDVIVDVVGGSGTSAFVERLAPNGRLVLVGAVAGLPPADVAASLLSDFQLSRSFGTFSLATVPVAERNATRAQLLAAAARRELTPVVHAVLPLGEAAEAHRQTDQGTVFGRVVLVP